jgi:hypothetical protein
MLIDFPSIHMPQFISEVQNTMQANLRQQVSEALANVSVYHARLILDPMTDVEGYPTPFLKRYRIYRVEHFNPNHPILFYVGFAPKQPAYLLTANPQNYVNLAQADAVVIHSPDVATDYATAYLEVTRSMSELFYIVNSVDDVRFPPNLTDKEAKVKASFMEQYDSIITRPAVEQKAQNYVVTVYAVRDQALECHSITVSQQGDIETDVITLEKDLPLVYGL